MHGQHHRPKCSCLTDDLFFLPPDFSVCCTKMHSYSSAITPAFFLWETEGTCSPIMGKYIEVVIGSVGSSTASKLTSMN